MTSIRKYWVRSEYEHLAEYIGIPFIDLEHAIITGQLRESEIEDVIFPGFGGIPQAITETGLAVKIEEANSFKALLFPPDTPTAPEITTAAAPYLDPVHLHYPEELARAVKLWFSIMTENPVDSKSFKAKLRLRMEKFSELEGRVQDRLKGVVDPYDEHGIRKDKKACTSKTP